MTDRPTPPVAREIPRALEIHGHVRQDPWYWLRDDERKDPAVLDWLKAENSYTHAVMKPTEALQARLFEELKGRLKKDDASVPVQRRGFWYYSRFADGKEYPIYCRRAGTMEAPEQIILDVNALAEGQPFFQVGDLEISENEQLLAWSEDTVGRRQYTLKVKDLRTGEVFADGVAGTAGALAWAADDKTIFYVKNEETTLRPYQVWRHTLGTPAASDALVFHEQDEAFYVGIDRGRSRRFVEIETWSTLVSEVLVLEATDPQGTFRPVVPRSPEHEYAVWHHGDAFYIRTNWQARNFRLMKAPVATSADRSTWTEILPHREDVFLGSVLPFDDFLAVEERRDALQTLRVIRWADGDSKAVPVDEDVFVAALAPGQNPEPGSTKLRYLYGSLRTPDSVFEYDMVSGARTLLKRDEVLGGFDPASYVVERVWAPARDGARVPVSVVRRTTTPVNGSAPLYQYGYGSYGYSIDPDFNAGWLSLLDRGFVVAIAHIRGGQELGRAWYDNGKMFNKMNTFHDFIDVTEHLVKQGYGARDQVFAGGGSAGGLLIGAVMNLRPDLYRGLHAAVPFVDVVTTMLDESIPLTTGEYDEWGNPNEKASYDYMLSYSPYDNLKAVDYPNLIVTTGLHDSQVQYFEPAKWVAKQRKLRTDHNLLVLDTDMDSGHGGASGRFKRYEKTALVYAFFLQILDPTLQRWQ
ncbi:MAG: S9 family peptidase [Myxococcales bacterium]|nr:S9 family peptidase [Myxococcales bacterium]